MSNLSDYLTTGTFPVFTDANYTAKSAEIIWVDSSSLAITITLPASPQTGANVRVGDSAQNAAVNNITVDRNSNTINGLSEDFVIDENNGTIDFIYTGSTWAINVPMFGTGGLTEAQVVNITSGIEHDFLRPGVELHLSGNSNPTQNTDVGVGTSGVYWGSNRYVCSASTDNHFHWVTKMPARYNLGTFRFRFLWTPNNTNIGVVRYAIWPMTAAGDMEPMADTLGSPVTVDDTAAGITGELHITPWTPNLTVADIANNTLISFLLMRQGSSGSDTYTGTIDLIGVEVEWTSDQPTDD